MPERTFFYDLPVVETTRVMDSPGFRDLNMLYRRIPDLRDVWSSTDFVKHQRMRLLLYFERSPDRAKIGRDVQVRIVGWCEDRSFNMMYSPDQIGAQQSAIYGERYTFRVEGVLYEIKADMSDDDYVLLLMSGKISTDRKRVGLGYSELPAFDTWLRSAL